MGKLFVKEEVPEIRAKRMCILFSLLVTYYSSVVSAASVGVSAT